MSTRGLSKPRLERFHRVLSGYVERGELPGLVALVSHNDDVHVEVLGRLAIGKRAPMKRDSLFRIASITKPVAAVAAMILVEEGRLRLDAPVDEWLPELANRRVLASLESLDETEPANRAITLRDLLTMTSGFGSIMAEPDTYPIQRLIREQHIGGDGPMLPADYPPTDEWMRRLGALPWLAQPGEQWMYHVSADILGVLIGRAAGSSLGAFMRDRIFEPLGMNDTAFFVPRKKAKRLAEFYRHNAQTNNLDVVDSDTKSVFLAEPQFESAGGGLVSTIDDYFAFSRMLLNKGRLGREQILSRASVELMTSDQVPDEHRRGAELFFGASRSWGFGVSVDLYQDDVFRSPGRFGWDGGFGTSAYTDPRNGMIGILFTQRMMDSPEAPHFYSDFWTLAYAAME